MRPRVLSVTPPSRGVGDGGQHSGKYFSGNHQVKFVHYSGKYHVKFENSVIFFLANIMKIGAFR